MIAAQSRSQSGSKHTQGIHASSNKRRREKMQVIEEEK
jgi:hypothetical protein